MGERATSRRRELWLPGLVGLSGALIALTGWGLLIADRRSQLLESMRQGAAETRAALEAGLEQQIATLRGLRDLWRDYGLRPPEEWAANANQQIDRVVGLGSVAWIDLDEPRNRVAAGRERSTAQVDLDVEEARLHSAKPHVEGPERNDAGDFVYRVFLPVLSADEHAGVLVAHFQVEPFLRSTLHARAGGYSLAVFWGTEKVYQQGWPSRDRWQRWWRVDEWAALPLGGRWRVEYRPTAELAQALLTPLPHYLLAAGLGLSVLFAVAVHQMRVIVRQSRFLAESNRALARRGRDLESEVAQRAAALEDALAELEAFNYSVSHDLRSPLGAILNFATILEEDYRERPLDAEAREILARIHRSASRATALLEDLLQLSRAGRAALSVETVDMESLAREMYAQLVASEPAGADVDFRVEPLPAAEGDETLLGTVFSNLLGNALKYTRGGEKRRIVVRGWSEGSECFYEVDDNGKGFDMRFVDKVFGLFERLHTADDVEGTGVGLALVSRIVKRHGGRVWAESAPGSGARFGFALPRSQPS